MGNQFDSSRLKNLSTEQRRKIWAKLASKRLSGYELVAKALKECGVLRVSGITGKPFHQVFGKLAERGIRIFGTRHQSPATLMAATDNFLNDKLVHAVIVSAGPPVMNTLTGVLHARDSHWPVLVMGGRSPLKEDGKGHFQELDAVPVFRPLTKWAAAVQSAEAIMPTIHEAIRIAMEGRPGPVYLDFPEDILQAECLPVVLPEITDPESPSPPKEAAELAMRILRKSERPLICFGEELRRGFNLSVLQSLVERSGIPFVTTQQGRGLMPDSHRSCMNIIRKDALARTDALVLVGSWFDWRLRMGASVNPEARIIHVHEDEKELGINVQAAIAEQGSPMGFLADLAGLFANSPALQISPWEGELEDLRQSMREVIDSWEHAGTEYMDSHAVLKILNDCLPPEAIKSIDGSLHLTIAQYHLEAEEPFSWFDPGWQGLIGGGIPFIMGALCAFPERPAIAITGDMGFGMGCMEFDTAVRHHLPIKVIILNNSGISGHHRQKQFLPKDHPERFSQFQDNLPYEAIVRSLGADGECVSSLAELPGAVKRLLSSQGPYCLNLLLNPAATAPPVW